MTTPLLSVEDAEVQYGDVRVLTGASFTVEAGEFVGLLGRNGAGKTTLLHATLGLLPMRAGEVRVGGVPIRELRRKDIARRVALLPQDGVFGSHFRVRDVVAMGRYAHRTPLAPESDADRASIDSALRATELQRLATRRVTELSGGERQRLLFARALAQEAPMLLLDEPTSNLDLVHQLETLERVRAHTREAPGRAALAALHDLSLAARYCDRLLLLDAGTIALDGPPEDVLHSSVLERYFGVEGTVERDPELGLRVVARRRAGTRAV